MALIPFDDRDGYIWYNGEMVPWRECKVHVLNHGLHYASSVFEGIRVYDDKIFKLTEHSQRLIDSAKLLGFSVPMTVEALNEATQAIVHKQGISNGYIRPVAWLGSERMKIYAEGNTVHVAIATWEWPAYFEESLYEKGLDLCWADWRRPAPDTAPTASKAAGLYMICTLSKRTATEKGYHDAMMLDYRGYLAEATGANVFLIINGELHTPTPDCFLDGITRRTVMDLATDKGMKIVERHIKPEELADAQEVFLTGTAAEVTPVGSIGDYRFTPGEITRTLMQAYKDCVHA